MRSRDVGSGQRCWRTQVRGRSAREREATAKFRQKLGRLHRKILLELDGLGRLHREILLELAGLGRLPRTERDEIRDEDALIHRVPAKFRDEDALG